MDKAIADVPFTQEVISVSPTQNPSAITNSNSNTPYDSPTVTQIALEDPTFHKGYYNFNPSDDLWYPPYLVGKWRLKLSFVDASFDPKINEQEFNKAANNGAIPGFKKYSVFFMPLIGKDVDTDIRFVQVDSHPREDHSYNIRKLVEASSPNTVVDKAPYSYQLSKNIFNIPANHWNIEYHDSEGSGSVSLDVIKREFLFTAGTIETTELYHQVHQRTDSKATTPSTTIDDYGLVWKLQVPEATRDEFITLEKLISSKQLVGSLNILAYLQPDTDLYLKVPAQPVGVFRYAVTMDRANEPNEVEKTTYPYVPDEDGPVDLKSFFGY